MTRWRLWASCALLLLGVALVASGGWWPLPGFVFLLLVPPLIVDQAVIEVRGR